jgi:carbamoyl-phosphate synthase large subunit
MIKNGQVQLIINTTVGKKAISDSFTMRREALQNRVSYYTTMAGARAACYALGELDAGNVACLQDLHKSLG